MDGRRACTGRAARAAVGLCAAFALTAAGCATHAAEPGADTADTTPATQRASDAAPGTARLRAALLAPSDMGSAFTAQSPPPSPSASATTTVSGCAQLGILLSVGVSLGPTDQGVTYQAADFGPAVSESLMTAPAGTAVAAVYAEDRAALASCKNAKISAEGGVTFAVALTPVTLGGPKAQSAAVRMDGTLEGVQINGYLALDDVGPAELAYLYIQVADGSSQLASHYFEQADAKARRELAI